MKRLSFFAITILHTLLVLFVLWGCTERPLTFQVRFDDVSGLQKDAPVYFDQNTIGQVLEIVYTQQGDYLVTVAINPEFQNAATVDSTFYVDYDLKVKGNMALMLVQEKPGGTLLQNGSIVQGSAGSGYLDKIIRDVAKTAEVAGKEMSRALEQLQRSLDAASQQLNTELEHRLDDLSRQLQEMNKEVRKVPDSRAVKQFEESVIRFAEEFNKAQVKVREHIRNEVIPQLRVELEQLRKQLEREGRQEELEEIDRRVKEMV